MSPRVSDLFLRSQSDERLVNLARAGHVRAFGAIVERYGPELAAFARRLSPDGRGEDLVQQAFLSAFAALRAGSDVKHLRGWLYQIVRNASARERPARVVPLDGSIPAPDTVEDVVAQRALALGALAELGRLPDRQREAMVGTALDGLARADVARSMGLTEGAVRQLIHRARRTVRSAVTALTPWPLASWLAAARPARSVGAASAGGVAVKLGVVVASGTLATGIAAVAIHRSIGHRHAARTATAMPARRGGASQPSRSVVASASPPIVVGSVGIRSSWAVAALPVSFVAGTTGAGAGRPNGHGGAGGRSGGGPGANTRTEATEQSSRSKHGGDGRGDGSGEGDVGRGQADAQAAGAGAQHGGDAGGRYGGTGARDSGGETQPAAGADRMAFVSRADGQGGRTGHTRERAVAVSARGDSGAGSGSGVSQQH
jgi:RNA polymerase sigma factor (sigma-70 family)